MLTEIGAVPLEVPRDREGSFDLNCDDISPRDFRVEGDPQGFDGDNDGRGCES